jgi:hypothetical protein
MRGNRRGRMRDRYYGRMVELEAEVLPLHNV